jgi:hypothetical protein
MIWFSFVFVGGVLCVAWVLEFHLAKVVAVVDSNDIFAHVK